MEIQLKGSAGGFATPVRRPLTLHSSLSASSKVVRLISWDESARGLACGRMADAGVNRSGDRGNLLTRVSADTKMILLSDRGELKKRDEFIDYACGGA